MSSFKIAPVRWYLGQTLLPEHFIAQEDALFSELRLRAELLGLPEYGIAQLSWNEPQLEEGQLAISSLRAILPGGVLLDVPGNCLISRLSLSASGVSTGSVYLHLLGETTKADGVPLYEDDAKVVQRVLYRAQLALQDSLDNSVGTIKLAEFVKSADGKWRLGVDYIPPLIQVGPSPFLRTQLQELGRKLEAFKAQLEPQLQNSFYRADRISSIRRTLAELGRIRSLLEDQKHQVYRHPYHLFNALRSLYFDLCAFQEKAPDRDVLPYIHTALGPTFKELLQFIDDRVHFSRARSTYLKFQVRDGMYTVNQLPQELSAASEVYVLVHREHLHDKVSLDGVKLSSPSRLVLVHRLALKGVPFKHIPNPAFPHSFGPDVDFYQLVTGEEWELALKEQALAFYQHPSLAKASTVFLFWRVY